MHLLMQQSITYLSITNTFLCDSSFWRYCPLFNSVYFQLTVIVAVYTYLVYTKTIFDVQCPMFMIHRSFKNKVILIFTKSNAMILEHKPLMVISYTFICIKKRHSIIKMVNFWRNYLYLIWRCSVICKKC